MINNIIFFLKRKFRDLFKKYLSTNDIKDLGNKNFVIISNNCWGAEVYQWYKRPYNSPFIGLLLYGSCYLKLLSNFDFYMNQKLEFLNKSKYPAALLRDQVYPIAKLFDIEIHFIHYHSEKIAKEKWERRTARMLEEKNINNYYFKMCDREGNDEFLEEFHKLSYKNKISYGLKDLSLTKNKNHIVIKEKEKNGKYIVNGKKLYKITFHYFDLHKWLKA